MDVVDLFAGVGGFTTAAAIAGCRVRWAANHWPAAVAWHKANHPEVAHSCQDLQQADWRDVPPHDLLLASPACQGHSRARGREQPHHDALRSTAWAVVSCCEAHRPAALLVENVPEFADWVLYPAWCESLRALGYALKPMVLDAADAGVPQNRRRLFIVGTRSRTPVSLQLPRLPHRAAGDVIDLEAGRWSPIHKPGRSAATLQRAQAGRAVLGRRFLMPYYGSGSGRTGRSLERPIGTLTTVARWAVVDGDRMRMVSVAEGRALMGLPDHYRLPANQAEAWKMIGNGVCPPQGAAIIGALKTYL